MGKLEVLVLTKLDTELGLALPQLVPDNSSFVLGGNSDILNSLIISSYRSKLSIVSLNASTVAVWTLQ